MKLLFWFLCLMVTVGYAQQAELLVFNEKIHDFGDIREVDGDANVEFTFTNNSGRTISVLAVQPSCGCTTPGWTKEPIAPGKQGSIKASFNPKGRPGYFNKSLTVTTDLDKTPVVLQIKGQVVTPDMATDNTQLTTHVGSLRLKSSSLNIGKVYQNKPGTPVEFRIFNAGTKPVAISSVVSPSYLKVVAPNVIHPNETASIQLLLDAQAKGQFGFISENIELITDDEDLPRKPFSVFASIEEFFPPLSAADLAKAPSLKLESNQVDMKVVKTGVTTQREVVVQNKGKQDLLIRAVQPNCGCITASLSQTKIKPGGEEKLTILFRGEGRKGTQNKSITLYSNDPSNPAQRISILAIVD